MMGSTATCAGSLDCDIIGGYLGVSKGVSYSGNFVGDIASTADSAGCAEDALAAWKAGSARTIGETMFADMGGVTFIPGVYTSGSAINIALANPKVYLDAEGDTFAVFIFNLGSTLTTCAGSEVVLLNGAKKENIFWVLGTDLTMGADSTLVGNVLAGSAINIGTNAKIKGRAIAQTTVICETACTVESSRRYGVSPEIGQTKKTNSYMPFMPVLDGYVQTHNTYRFLSVREQVLTVIGEAKHGLWRIADNGMVRLYRKHDAVGVPVGADVDDPSIQADIMTDYKPFLAPGPETGDTGGWGGYRYSQDADGDGQAAFVDVPIYHPYFDSKYEDHVPIDLPHWFCTMSGANFTNARNVWEYATKQPNANVVGPLGKRAGLDINEHYTNIIRFENFSDAKFWVQVGMGDESKDVFDQTDIDDGSMSMDVAYRALDTPKVNMEIYLIERPFFNVPYHFVTTVIDNKENSDMRYTRPDGLYWKELEERELTTGLKTEMTFDPVMPVIDGDSQVDKVMRYTPLYGMNHLDRPTDEGSGGGWCPQKGGDWGSYPTNPGGSGFPNEYEEATPVCDGLVQDIKMFANLDAPTWNSPTFQLQNAGTLENPQVYLGEGNQYGEFTDAFNEGKANPHKLFFTNTDNPDPKPVQKITVTFEGIGVANKYVDPVTDQLMPAVGLTEQEAADREAKISAAV
jgi:hypothetical protein